MVLPDSHGIPRAPRYLGSSPHDQPLSRTGLLPPAVALSNALPLTPGHDFGSPATPAPVARARFRLAPLRSPLLGGSMFLSFPPGTKMFQFPGCPLRTYFIHYGVTGVLPRRVAPFGYPRFNACLRLPVAYRSLPRPSSAPVAKASTTHTCSLDLSRALDSSLPAM